MDWLKPAMAFMALSSLVLALSFFYVWGSLIRRRYVLSWALAWTAAIPHLFFTWRLLDRPASHPAWTLQQLFLVLNALLMVGGSFEFVHRRFPTRGILAVSVPFLLWAICAPFVTDRFFEVTLPSSALLGLSYLWTSSRFLLLRRERGTRGAGLVAGLFLVAGLHEFDYPLIGGEGWPAAAGYFLAATLAIAISLALLVMILEESRAEADRERARMRAILDNLPVGVLVTNSEGEVLLANGLARRLVPAELPTGQSVAGIEADVFRRPDGTPCGSDELPIAHALRTGTAWPARELLLDGAGGSSHAVLVNAGPVHDEKNHKLGAVAVFQEIDELKRMQSEVARAQRLQGLGTLAAGVAHDFNNALTMILGHAELAVDAATDPVVRQQLDVITRVASDSAAIVRRIQDVARTRSTRDSVVFDLAQVAREVVDIARPRWRDEAQACGVHYEVHTDLAHGVSIVGHPAEMREALLNLVFNALDAMPGGGVLSLTVAHSEVEAVLRVSDSGLGMSAQVRERIFDPFFTTKGPRGTGLGLAVVFGIVQRHDGRIAVESQPGSGATFLLHFPLRAPEEATAPAPAPEPTGIKARLLVVDDEDLVRNLMGSLLRLEGHEVSLAASGEEAIRLVEAADFDLVLTDLGMPTMNGWEVAAATRRIRPHVQVVMVTGWGDALSPEDVRQAGVARVLSKPFTRVQIVECVRDVIRLAATTVA